MASDDPQILTLENGTLPPPTPPHRSGEPVPSASTPLLPSSPEVDAAARRLETFLTALGLIHSSPPCMLYSLFSFFLLGVAVPIAAVLISDCEGNCEVYRVLAFEVNVLVSQTVLGALALTFVSTGMRRHGVGRFVCVNRGAGELVRFQKGYADKIGGFFKLLFWWILPCFIVKTAREITRFMYIYKESLWRALILLLFSTISWIYLTAIFLSACMLFSLVCTLQILHFEEFIKLFSMDTDLSKCLEEHIRLRCYLLEISHRFRGYLLPLFLVVSGSETVSLIQTTGSHGVINFINAGDLAVASVVQVVGTVLCLNAASKISHRVQSIASVASKWHASLTCSSSDSSQSKEVIHENLDRILASSLIYNASEGDLESLNNTAMQETLQLASNGNSYQKRQALVTYLQTNPGGITIYGWTVDRALINTIFFIELSLVLFVLGKTIVISQD